ncbi:MAG TPA: hypothetical protein VNK04_21025 [Gemmataceae bacterium]|nr:hypothetical protein [Gemmataceae bacterium]
MPIPLKCACGRSFAVKDELAGKKVRCPYCRGIIAIPEFAQEVGEEEAIQTRPGGKPAKESSRRSSVQDRPPKDKPGKQPLLRAEGLKRKKRRQPLVIEKEESPPTALLNVGVVGGAIIMLIAAAWFTFGLLHDTFFCYPPLMFTIGLFAVIRGVMRALNTD